MMKRAAIGILGFAGLVATQGSMASSGVVPLNVDPTKAVPCEARNPCKTEVTVTDDGVNCRASVTGYILIAKGTEPKLVWTLGQPVSVPANVMYTFHADHGAMIVDDPHQQLSNAVPHLDSKTGEFQLDKYVNRPYLTTVFYLPVVLKRERVGGNVIAVCEAGDPKIVNEL